MIYQRPTQPSQSTLSQAQWNRQLMTVYPRLQQQLLQQPVHHHDITSRTSEFRHNFSQIPVHSPTVIQCARVATSPVADGIQIEPLKQLIQAQREEISAILKTDVGKSFLNSDSLDLCYKKLTSVYLSLIDSAQNPLDVWDAFTKWTEDDGATAWETYISLKNDREAEQAKLAPKSAKAIVWSDECNEVFADMGTQFDSWDGTLQNRGAWWGSSRPGSTTGAKRVPSSVVQELKKRVGGTNWRFSDSWTGGVSFHRSRGSIDFIYHMLPPG
jgi:hypothetical protein